MQKFCVTLIHFWFCCLWVWWYIILKSLWQDHCQGAFFQWFLLEVLLFQASYVSLLFIFSSIFMNRDKKSNFILLSGAIYFSQYLWKIMSFPHCGFLAPLLKKIWTHGYDVISWLCLFYCSMYLFLWQCQFYKTICNTVCHQEEWSLLYSPDSPGLSWPWMVKYNFRIF